MPLLDILTFPLDADDSGAAGWAYREVIGLPDSAGGIYGNGDFSIDVMASVWGMTVSGASFGIVDQNGPGWFTKQTPIQCSSGFTLGPNGVTTLYGNLNALGYQPGDALMFLYHVANGAPKRNVEFGVRECCRSGDSSSFLTAQPSGSFFINPAFIGAVLKFTALDFQPPAEKQWCPVGGKSVKMYPSDTVGQYIYELPNGSKFDPSIIAADPSGGLQTILNYGRDYNIATEIGGSVSRPYNPGANITVGPYCGHDVDIRNFCLEPQVPYSGRLVTFLGFDRSATFSWRSGWIRGHAADPTAVLLAYKPTGYRILYPDGSFDGSPNHPGKWELPTVEAIKLPGFAKTISNNLVLWAMNESTSAFNGGRVLLGNVDGAGMVKTPIRVTDSPNASYGYNVIDFGRLAGFLDIGVCLGDSDGDARGFLTGTKLIGYMETGKRYGGLGIAGIKSSETFGDYSDVRAIIRYGGGLQNGVLFTAAASNNYMGKSVNGRYRTQFYGTPQNANPVTDQNGNNDH